MKYTFIAMLFFSLNVKVANSQSSKFDELNDKLFFNIFIHKPDSSVFAFIQRYFPEFTNPPYSGGWTISPPEYPLEEVLKTEHTFIFRKHPFFDFVFEEGRLKISASEAKSLLPRITHTNLCFTFNSKKEAENGLVNLLNIFKGVIKSRKLINLKDKKVILISDKSKVTISDCDEFVLFKDEVFENKYKILFQLGAFTFDEKYYKLK
jgi:hypothetical protein